MSRRFYSEEDYFNFLYDLAFENDDYFLLAKLLHSIPFEWVLRMDENRVDDGIEIRKYYLADKNGYLPKDIDVDDYIFPKTPSVFEVWVGFSNKICRDMCSNWEIYELINMFLENLEIKVGNWGIKDKEDFVKKRVEDWMLRKKNHLIFKNIWGIGENDADLWTQACHWASEL